jgi:putative FmdB family regulatory protein
MAAATYSSNVMPLYEYQCEECDHRFEVIQKSFSDPQVQTCPKCGGPVRKLMSSPAIQFKGSGFYITDYARKDSAAESKSESSASADSGTKTEKTDKSDKSEKSEKSEKPAAAGSSEANAKPTASPKAPADPVK